MKEPPSEAERLRKLARLLWMQAGAPSLTAEQAGHVLDAYQEVVMRQARAQQQAA